jgi:hypothetical protein
MSRSDLERLSKEELIEQRLAAGRTRGRPMLHDLIRISRQRPLVALVTGLGPARPGADSLSG